MYWAAFCSIARLFHFDFDSFYNSSALPPMAPVGSLVSPLWVVWAVIHDNRLKLYYRAGDL